MKIKKLIEKVNKLFVVNKKSNEKKIEKIDEIIIKLKDKKSKIKRRLKEENIMDKKKESLQNELIAVNKLLKKANKEKDSLSTKVAT